MLQVGATGIEEEEEKKKRKRTRTPRGKRLLGKMEIMFDARTGMIG
jgi:hypothetical protein